MVDHGTGARGQSQLLGIVLLFALVFAVTSTVVVVGGQEINQASSDATLQRADTTMLEFQSAVASVTDESSGQVAFDTGSNAQAATGGARVEEEGSVSVNPDEGHVTVTVFDHSAGTTHTVVDQDVGTVVYAQEGERVAYQGGAVFRKDRGSAQSLLLSPPAFEYTSPGGDPTLSLQLTKVTTGGDRVSGSGLRIEPIATDTAAPAAGLPSLPLAGKDEVTITVQSKYYQAWGSYLGQETGLSPSFDHDAESVTLTFSNPREPDAAVAPFVSLSTTQTDVSNQVTVDGYNSDRGTYASQSHSEPPVYVYGDLKVESGAHLNDVYATGSVENRGTVRTAYHDGSYSETAGATGTDGGAVPSRAMPDVENHDTAINDRIAAIHGTNDNPGSSSTIQAIENANCGESEATACVLGPGDYHVSGIDLNSRDELIFKPQGETIRVATPGGIDVRRNSEIEVRGEGNVVVYSNGDVHLRSGALVTNNGKDAPQFRVWQDSDQYTELGAETRYVGFIHAGKDGRIDIASNDGGHIYGAVVGDLSNTGASRPFHYDRALSDVRPPGSDPGPRQVGYLRISTTEVHTADGD